MDKKVSELLLKARVEMMTRSVFISTIALSVEHKLSDKIPTAGTDGRHIYYNPKFIVQQSVQQLAGLIAHECWHIAFQHISRLGNRDQKIWNIAGDFVINYLLQQAGFMLPVDALIDPKYDQEWSTDTVYNDLVQNSININFPIEIQDLKPELNQGSPDDQSTSDITGIIVRAKIQAEIHGDRNVGSIPAEISRLIDKLISPKLPWNVILNRFLDQRERNNYSWSRKNRRYKEYLPSLYNYGLGNLTFAIDTSSSISEEEMQTILSEIQGIRDTFNPEKITLIDCDTTIHNIISVDQTTNLLSLKLSGGGGTSFIPVLAYMEKNPANALIYFTDLYGEEELEEVNYPILWICTSEHKPSKIGETIYFR